MAENTISAVEEPLTDAQLMEVFGMELDDPDEVEDMKNSTMHVVCAGCWVRDPNDLLWKFVKDPDWEA